MRDFFIFFWEGGSKTARFNNLRKKIRPPLFLKIVLSQTNIRNAIFDQRSTRPPEVGVSQWHRHTDIHTYGHGDLLTNSAQWGRVGENETTGGFVLHHGHTKKLVDSIS